ncbi:MAG: hypothetical protein DRP16_02915 [Candidatus Aenigmatarchaeota archaeon]|nr:MAG: hypothetical protein DRP16_02915 [Candidatus Aenigmarchaeota archaeon]
MGPEGFSQAYNLLSKRRLIKKELRFTSFRSLPATFFQTSLLKGLSYHLEDALKEPQSKVQLPNIVFLLKLLF